MFNYLSIEEKIHSLAVRATALFAETKHEYATVTINITDYKDFQVYFVMWDEGERIVCDEFDRHLEEEKSLDEALNRLNEFLLSFEVGMLVCEGKEIFSDLSV